jgi:hypothetical protein
MAEPLIISVLPREQLSPEQLGSHIDAELVRCFSPACLSPDLLSPAQSKILDDLIIRQTETLGDLALASPIVLGRVHAWRDHPLGIARMQRFCAALVKAVRVHQHKAKPPLDSRMLAAKRKTVDELRAAFKVLRGKFRAAKKDPKIKDFTVQFLEVIQPGGFLQANADSWCAFFAADFQQALDSLNGPRFSPAALYDAWAAWATGYTQETLRQKVSSSSL